MSDKSFLDTNIILYSYSKTEPKKQKIARGVALLGETFISTQVLSESANVLRKKFKLNWSDISNTLHEISLNYKVLVNNMESINLACKIAGKYQFSIYDSLIIAAALESNCQVLYSEDMHHGQLIENKLTIINPFV